MSVSVVRIALWAWMIAPDSLHSKVIWAHSFGGGVWSSSVEISSFTTDTSVWQISWECSQLDIRWYCPHLHLYTRVSTIYKGKSRNVLQRQESGVIFAAKYKVQCRFCTCTLCSEPETVAVKKREASVCHITCLTRVNSQREIPFCTICWHTIVLRSWLYAVSHYCWQNEFLILIKLSSKLEYIHPQSLLKGKRTVLVSSN